MDIPIPKSMQYLFQYAQKTEFVSCTLIGWISFKYSIMSSFSFKIPTVRSPDEYAIFTTLSIYVGYQM